jgi:hypothetical protein
MGQSAESHESTQARHALTELMEHVETLPAAIACAEGAAALLLLPQNGATTEIADLCWEAGQRARQAFPDNEPIAAAWARTLCHLTSAYGAAELLPQTFRCQETRQALADQFRFSESVQYWNAQSNFEMVTLLARRGYGKSLPIYLDNLRTLARDWHDRPAFPSLYAMALANAAAAYSQLQNLPQAIEQVNELRQLTKISSLDEVRRALPRALQQLAWYCGELVQLDLLHAWAMELSELLSARSVQRECGSRAVAEFGVYAVYFLQQDQPDFAADLLREGCRWLSAVTLSQDDLPMVVSTFRDAAAQLRSLEPALAQLAESRTARLIT